jgi:nucleoside-diphosphate-sugar epimerase
MKVFVTGATGVIGTPTVHNLLAAGHEVLAVARSDEKAAVLARAGATPVRVDLFDPDAVAAALGGIDAVANLATHIPPLSRASRASGWAENDRIRTEVSTNLVDAALAGGATRLVQESITFIYPDRGDDWIDESVPIEPPLGTASVLVAEGNAARFTAGGGGGVVLRFALFYGPGSFHTQAFVKAARRGVGVTAGRPGGYLSSIHADDAAAAVVAALGVEPGTYNVADDEPVTRRQFTRILGDAVGRAPRVRVPGRLASLGGRRSAAMTRSQRIANRRFKEASGWAPAYPSVGDGVTAVVAALDGASDGVVPHA